MAEDGAGQDEKGEGGELEVSGYVQPRKKGEVLAWRIKLKYCDKNNVSYVS